VRPNGRSGASWRRRARAFVVRAVVAACAAARGRTRGALACVVNPVFFPDSIHQPLELAGGELGAVDMRVLGDAGDECVGAAVADALGGAGVSQVTGVFGDGGELGDELVLDHDHGVFSPSRGGDDSSRPHQAAGCVARIVIGGVLGDGGDELAETAFAGGRASGLGQAEQAGDVAAGGALLGGEVQRQRGCAAGVSVGHGFLLRAV